MSIKWLGDTSHNNKDKFGERLITTYVHTGNTEFRILSVDWASGMVTFTQPHGITVGSTSSPIIMCVSSWDISNPTLDMKVMPIEWMKPQGVSNNTANVGLALKAIDATSAYVVKASDNTTVITVNTGAIENPAIDHTKFHFELPDALYTIDNLPLLKRFKIRFMGYYKQTNTTSGAYRYTGLYYTAEDGTTNNMTPYTNLLGIQMTGNPYNGAGMYQHAEWILDYTTQQAILEHYTVVTGRRAGYANLQDKLDNVNNAGRIFFNMANPVKGITKISTMLGYQYVANGMIIQIIDLGGGA